MIARQTAAQASQHCTGQQGTWLCLRQAVDNHHLLLVYITPLPHTSWPGSRGLGGVDAPSLTTPKGLCMSSSQNGLGHGLSSCWGFKGRWWLRACLTSWLLPQSSVLPRAVASVAE